MEKWDFDRFSLLLGQPVAVIQGESYEKVGWGPYQFPKLYRTRKGAIICKCTAPGAQDDIADYESAGVLYGKASEDGGKTWRPITREDIPVAVQLPGGCEFIPPKPVNSFEADWLQKYTPDIHFDKKDPSGNAYPDFYDSDKIAEYPKKPVGYGYDPASGKTEVFQMQVNWPHFAMLTFSRPDGKKLIYPMEMVMNDLMGHFMVDPDGTIFFCTYKNGFSGATGKEAWLYTVTVLRSDDRGRSWQWVSEVLTTPEYDTGTYMFEGFCEPHMQRMSDGSVIMLMRTGTCCPSYLVRSTDGCKTWSKPQLFDRVGVLPQLLRLGCGVTLASYGRPGVFLRATADEKGLAWEQPIELLDEGTPSCSYTALLPLDDNSALMTYSHFTYSNPGGVPVKTVFVRRVTVKRKETVK